MLAAQALPSMVGIPELITFDMGGTSTDVALLPGGQCRLASEAVVHGYTIKAPMLDIHTVGAGGGSIAFIDSGGLMKVCPRSAGADPGPVCYGRGSTEPHAPTGRPHGGAAGLGTRCGRTAGGAARPTHSLPAVSEIAGRVAVMYAGQVVEEGSVREVFARPLHPYTKALLASAPHEDGSLPAGIPGMAPSPHALPPGCSFAPRCPRHRARYDAPPTGCVFRTRCPIAVERCADAVPTLAPQERTGHRVACIRAGEPISPSATPP